MHQFSWKMNDSVSGHVHSARYRDPVDCHARTHAHTPVRGETHTHTHDDEYDMITP